MRKKSWAAITIFQIEAKGKSPDHSTEIRCTSHKRQDCLFPDSCDLFFTECSREQRADGIVTVVLPANDQKEAEELPKSEKLVQSNTNELEVSISRATGVYKWIFAKDKDGYTLKQ